jgi:hypothetical protein
MMGRFGRVQQQVHRAGGFRQRVANSLPNLGRVVRKGYEREHG